MSAYSPTFYAMQNNLNSYQKKQTRFDAAHPFRALAGAIIHRLENPKLRASQRDAAPLRTRGSNGRKSIVAGYTPCDGQKTVSFGGFKQSALSPTDCADVAGAIALALCAAPTEARHFSHSIGIAYRGEIPSDAAPALTPSEELSRHGACLPCRVRLGMLPLSFAHWKQAFGAARATLGMKRKTAREDLNVSLESLQTAMREGQGADLLETEAARRAREAERAAEKAALADTRARVACETRRLHSLICAAHRAEIANAERKAKSNFRTALRHLRRAIAATLGDGHGHEKTRTAAYERDKVFRAYLAKGEAQTALERDVAQAAWQADESARLMFAVAE